METEVEKRTSKALKREKPMILRPIGVVRSDSRDTFTIPLEGVRAKIIVHRKYAKALDGIRNFSHLFVICWLHLSDTEPYRKVLKVRAVRIAPDLPESGVFASRSPIRPNPLSLSVVRLLSVRGNVLTVDRLDVIDGTPVVDIKPYTPAADSYPKAQSFSIPLLGHEEYLTNLFFREATIFHGERCPEIAIGSRMIVEGLSRMEVENERDPLLKVTCLKSGHLVDAVQSIIGATAGGTRLRIVNRGICSLVFRKGRKTLRVRLNPRFRLSPRREKAVKDVMSASADELLVFRWVR